MLSAIDTVFCSSTHSRIQFYHSLKQSIQYTVVRPTDTRDFIAYLPDYIRELTCTFRYGDTLLDYAIYSLYNIFKKYIICNQRVIF